MPLRAADFVGSVARKVVRIIIGRAGAISVVGLTASS